MMPPRRPSKDPEEAFFDPDREPTEEDDEFADDEEDEEEAYDEHDLGLDVDEEFDPEEAGDLNFFEDEN